MPEPTSSGGQLPDPPTINALPWTTSVSTARRGQLYTSASASVSASSRASCIWTNRSHHIHQQFRV
jgi:hypothetical protein